MTVTIHPQGTGELLVHQLTEFRKLARHAMKDATHVAAQEMRHLAPGSISEHIEERLGGGPGEVTGVVFPTEYFAKYVDEGTGVYVEFHQPIAPKAARLQANPRAALKLGDGGFRKSVKGQPPQRFVERAKEHSRPQVERLLERPAVEITNLLTR